MPTQMNIIRREKNLSALKNKIESNSILIAPIIVDKKKQLKIVVKNYIQFRLKYFDYFLSNN